MLNYWKISRKLQITESDFSKGARATLTKSLSVWTLQARNQNFFRAGEVPWNQGTLTNISLKHTRKKGPAGKIWEFFLLDTLKTIPWIEDLTQRWIKSGLFFFLRRNSAQIYTEWKLLSIRDLPNLTLYFTYLPLHKVP